MWWRSRDLDAPAAAVWEVLVDLDRWPLWGPTVRRATLDDDTRRLGPTSTGHVRPVVGPAVAFAVTDWDEGRLWAWSVAGVPATHHRVVPRGPDRCRLAMAAPVWAPAYLPVLDLALRRIERLVASAG